MTQAESCPAIGTCTGNAEPQHTTTLSQTTHTRAHTHTHHGPQHAIGNISRYTELITPTHITHHIERVRERERCAHAPALPFAEMMTEADGCSTTISAHTSDPPGGPRTRRRRARLASPHASNLKRHIKHITKERCSVARSRFANFGVELSAFDHVTLIHRDSLFSLR